MFDILIFLHGSEAFRANFCIWCCFLCIQVSFGNWETKETWKICNFHPKASEPCLNIDISNVGYCDPCFRKWPIFPTYTSFQVWPIFPGVTYFSSVTHFPNVTFFRIWPMFPSVTHAAKCDTSFPFFFNVTHFSKREPSLNVWLIFPSVTHFSICDPFFQVWSHVSLCDPFFSNCEPFFKMRSVFIKGETFV